MAVKLNMRRIVGAIVWGVVGTGVLVLLVAAVRYRKNNACKGIHIEISGPSSSLFVDKKGIADLLVSNGVGKHENRPIQSFNLRRLETALEKNVWIERAQLFFDNNGILRVNVVERQPVARVFTSDGGSCYIDSTGVQLPLQEKVQARLPVFTGYPAVRIRLQGRDSILTRDILRLSDLIRQDTFWSAQVAQINIRADRTFELMPEVGSHRVTLGDGGDIEGKFHRLFVFYREVLSRTGFDKYSRIDVSYAGQVIGIKKGSEESRYDSVQGMNNIRQLILSAQQLQQDTLRQNIRPLEHSTVTEQSLATYDLVPDSPAVGDTKPAAVTSGESLTAAHVVHQKSVKHQTNHKPVVPARKPRAVMRRQP